MKSCFSKLITPLRIGFLFLWFGLGSCSKVHFTSAIRSDLEEKQVDLRKVQFYNDRTLILKREVTTDEAKVISGKVHQKKGRLSHVIKIKRNTPGVCEGFSDSTLLIAFETGEGHQIKFQQAFHPHKEILYRIKPSLWDKTGAGLIPYEGQTYFIDLAQADTFLKIKKQFKTKSQKKKRKVQGRRID